MKTRHQILLFVYWLALLADCYCIFTQSNHLRFFTKGALMPLLIIYFLVNASRKHHLPSRILVIIALLFAWAGDIFLLFDGQTYFIVGLVSFLVMHLVYCVYFLRIHRLFPVSDPVIVGLPLVLIGIYDYLLMRKILPFAGELQYPLIAYMAVISLMLVFACNALGHKRAKSVAAKHFIPGAFVFIISDSLLGLNMFIWEDHIVGLAIMLTYGYAQHLMVHGFIKHVRGR